MTFRNRESLDKFVFNANYYFNSLVFKDSSIYQVLAILLLFQNVLILCNKVHTIHN